MVPPSSRGRQSEARLEAAAILLENAVDVYLYRAAFFDNHLQGQSRNQHQNLPEEEIDRSLDVYSHGRPVSTSKRYGEGQGGVLTHVWHLDPAHHTNQFGQVIEFCQGPFPFRYRYATVIEPGVLGEVRKEEETGEEVGVASSRY